MEIIPNDFKAYYLEKINELLLGSGLPGLFFGYAEHENGIFVNTDSGLQKVNLDFTGQGLVAEVCFQHMNEKLLQIYSRLFCSEPKIRSKLRRYDIFVLTWLPEKIMPDYIRELSSKGREFQLL